VGEKATSGLRFNTRPLAESQIGDDRRCWIYRKTQRTTVRGWDLFVWLKGLAFGYFDKNPAA